VLLQRNKDQEYNNPLVSFLTCFCRQSIGHERTALSVLGGSRSRCCPDGPRFHLSSPAFMPSCMRPEVRLPLDQRVLCSDSCKKMYYALA